MANEPLTFQVATTLLAQRIVTHNTGTAEEVKLPGAALELPVGITTDSVTETNQGIPVATTGFATLLFNDTVASGALVASDTAGRGIPFVDVTAGASYVGTLVGQAVSATLTIARVLVNPGYKAIP